ncbi:MULTISPECIES: biotin/lipoyl-containing protein [Candidatus Chloroploca]|uniref:Acetyl-CoA carboxylase biotin carboxyl carrier protein subunit n=1 Tax=Candidatus Chloroploca asiatica TaxID=1506545 RepID=A0A2H3L4X6_9CHLR|nr:MULTISPECIES: acetyl-CoA carboxylase biotin carboxyl carrier protein subunit [Candidatus Chloroploca]PDV99904.1 acetyl-CoA carboxylase biotin carboxyl carrier protein subunit [Candidatus Chloroploca asiatica]
MKRLRITVNGVSYEVDVEVLEDDTDPAFMSGPVPSPIGMGATAPRPPAPPRPAAAPAPKAPSPPPAAGGANALTSPLAGIVVDVKVKVGDVVKENDALLVIEAMKMNTNVSSPNAGTIKSISVKAGDSVRQGQVLLEFA